jgi:M6 family metalloprotease-like protein
MKMKVGLANVRPSASVLVIGCLGFLIWAAVAVLWSSTANAVPAAPGEITLEQPDGTTIEARLFGDEFNNGFETTEGYTIVRNPETEAYEYAEEDAEGELQPSGTSAEDDPPSGIERGLRPQPRGGDAPKRAQALEDPALAIPNTGTQRSLVILVQFNDQSSSSTAAQWASKFHGSTDSVEDYYDEVSYGNLTIDPATESHGTANDGVVGWLTLNQNHPNTAGNTGQANRLLTRDAVNAANPHVNFAQYDTNNDGFISSQELHVTVIAAGQEASFGASGKSVWGHNWSLFGTEQPSVDGKTFGDDAHGGGYNQFGEMHGTHMATIGIMVHEMGHDLYLPDLYDTDLSSEGVGEWSVMGSGSWLAVSGTHAGSTPPHPDPFSKWYEGWITPQQVTGSQVSTSIPQTETNSTATRQILNNPNGVDWTFGSSSGTGEYFLLENRQRVGYDAALPGTGLLIWHIDETRTSSNSANATESRKLVDLEEADGFGHLDSGTNRGDAGDPYPGSGNKTLFNGTSNPNSNLYSGSSSNVTVSNISGSSSTMTATISTTSSGGGDTIAPTVFSSVPIPFKTGVRRGANITTTFSEAMDTSTLIFSPGVYNAEVYRENTDGSFTFIPSAVSFSSDGKTITINPNSRLAKKKWHMVRLWNDSAGFKDLAGNQLAAGGNYQQDSGGYIYFWFKTGIK